MESGSKISVSSLWRYSSFPPHIHFVVLCWIFSIDYMSVFEVYQTGRCKWVRALRILCTRSVSFPLRFCSKHSVWVCRRFTTLWFFYVSSLRSKRDFQVSRRASSRSARSPLMRRVLVLLTFRLIWFVLLHFCISPRAFVLTVGNCFEVIRVSESRVIWDFFG